ncbi:MAG TPA: aminopeptidase P family protein [Ruminococcaceae bacterium]|nr:aminopeptidase P family protein [Oscillospiraceae bacterium]
MEHCTALRKVLPANIDAAMVLSEHNRFYLTGFAATDGILLMSRKRALLLADSRYIEAAREQASGCEVVLMQKPIEQMKSFFKEEDAHVVGIESRELPVAEWNRFREQLPGFAIDAGDELNEAILQLRMVKGPEELGAIRRAQRITDDAFKHILPFLKPGAMERDIALEIEYFMRKQGATGPSFDLIVVSGENSSRPHGVPGTRKLQSGDFVTMDTGAIVDGYCSDMTRTVAIGHATEEMRKVYRTVLAAQLAAEKALAPGKTGAQVDKVARDIIDDAGYKGCFGHGLGHSVGLQIHEEPHLSPTGNEVLLPGMMMTVEPGIYLEGQMGVRIEDLTVLTEDGCKILTESPKELLIL